MERNKPTPLVIYRLLILPLLLLLLYNSSVRLHGMDRTKTNEGAGESC